MADVEHIECGCKDCVASRLEFNAWADAFDQRWAEHKRANAELACELAAVAAQEGEEWTPVDPATVTECPLCGHPLNSERLFHKDCADAEQMAADGWGEEDFSDPSFNAHPAALR